MEEAKAKGTEAINNLKEKANTSDSKGIESSNKTEEESE